jgi:iron complex outermembrane receptor protein
MRVGLAAWIWVASVCVGLAAAQALDVPAGDAVKSLRLFARQAGVQLVFPADDVRGHRTNEVAGRLEPRHALEMLLRGSGLTFVEDPATGAFVVRKEMQATKTPAHMAAAPAAGGGESSGAAARSGADEQEIVLSPFEIQTSADSGYRPANSISATRISEPISTLPMSVSAFTEEFIADQKPYDLYDVVKWTPGVHQDNISPQGWVRYALRGFTAASIQRNGFGSFRFIDTTNIARVEVVKGPSSLLYGQINPGGVINYVTKRPAAQPEAEFSASVGTHGYSRFVLDATGAVAGTQDAVLVRAVAMTETIQEFQELAEGRKSLVAPSLQWKLNDRVSIAADFEHFERLEDMLTGGAVLIYENGVATVPYPGLPRDFSYAGVGDYQDFVSDALTVELDARLGDDMHLRGTYLDSSWDMEWRASGQGATGLISQAAIDTYYPPAAGLTPADAMIRRNRWEHQWGGERSGQVDLTGTWELSGATVRPLVGVKHTFESHQRSLQNNNPTTPGNPYYIRPWDLRDPSTWDRSVPFGVDALVRVADLEVASDGTSCYAVVSAEAMQQRLHVLAGYALHEVRNHPALDHVAGTAAPAVKRSEDVPQLGALYKVSREFSVFATYSESFLANPTMLRVDNVPTTQAAPSIGRGWEAGAKVEWWGGRVSGTVSAYAINASPSGIIVVTSGISPEGTTLFTDIQGGEQESTGFEAELYIAPTHDLQVFAAFGTCDAIYTVHPTDPALNGTRLVAAPEETANVWCKYTFARRGTARFTVSGGIIHVGEMAYVGNNPDVRLPAYTTLDLGVGCAFRLWDHPWTADILVKNVTDERYNASASSWGFPRHAILSLGTRF